MFTGFVVTSWGVVDILVVNRKFGCLFGHSGREGNCRDVRVFFLRIPFLGVGLKEDQKGGVPLKKQDTPLPYFGAKLREIAP